MKGILRLKGRGDKQMKTKSRYTWFGNICYTLKCAWDWDRKLFYYQFLPVLPNVISGFMGVWIPSRLVRGLEEGESLGVLLAVVGGCAVLMWLMQLLGEGMDEYVYRNSVMLNRYYEIECCKKIMALDYDMLEHPDHSKLIGNVWNFLGNEHRCRSLLSVIPGALAALVGIGWYGGMIAGKNALILFLAAVNTLCSFGLMRYVRRKHVEYQKEVGKFSKRTAYINRQAMERKPGKDIRLFRMADWILEKYEDSLMEMDGIYRRIHGWYFRQELAEVFLWVVMNGFSYTYLLFLLLKGELTTAAFVLYIGLIGDFSLYFNQLVKQIISMNPANMMVGYVREFLDLPEENGWGQHSGPGGDDGAEIVFQNVSYTYPGESNPALKNINIKIRGGEKLALIGLNGAGKTTLVKLLCGFYKPTEGQILINGIPIQEYKRDEYQKMLAALFQDSSLLPFTVDENLTAECSKEIDHERIKQVLELAGFREKYESLPWKGETLLVREVYKQALDFSGGERQKFLFGRALYKKASILILDEPTAALDPIAENELYLKYRDAAAGKTSIFISHRLSSTRFCDRILLMEEGRIVEEGTHQSLMEQNGRYAELFEVQSKYYREEEGHE